MSWLNADCGWLIEDDASVAAWDLPLTALTRVSNHQPTAAVRFAPDEILSINKVRSEKKFIFVEDT